VKFLVDMPLSPDLAAWLREQGHDAVHTVALQLDRAPDVEILGRANLEGRTVITADLDYPRLLALAELRTQVSSSSAAATGATPPSSGA
jgi:predicted nuclease of predicted toxin-antitoxin system